MPPFKILAAAVMLSFFAAALVSAQGATRERDARVSHHQTLEGSAGREVAAPSWSATCMTDHGPTRCDEPMWIYGTPSAIERYKSAF
jgi:hypothetical protein